MSLAWTDSGLLNPETSAITIRPLHLPHNIIREGHRQLLKTHVGPTYVSKNWNGPNPLCLLVICAVNVENRPTEMWVINGKI